MPQTARWVAHDVTVRGWARRPRMTCPVGRRRRPAGRAEAGPEVEPPRYFDLHHDAE
jgi:hypothetical protein